MNLGDPELELIDPTPDVHSLFLHFDKVFFWTTLANRAVVRWSKRMYSCAGICSYDRGGLCDIALSEPLLKLRPRKDLIETLLHEMIHAYLFVTCRDQDRDGHGPNFKEHMHRINKAAGLNISIYHDFHDEVEMYRTHWWRCNGPCQTRKPYFGIVRRTANRAPGPSDYWWKDHLRKCGGTFMKIKEPENNKKRNKITASTKSSGDITKYINTNTNTVIKPVLKDMGNVPAKTNVITKSNSNSTIVVSKKSNIVFNPKPVKSPTIFSGKGHTIKGTTIKTTDVTETVRNVWANKQLTPISSNKSIEIKKVRNSNGTSKSVNTSKHENAISHISSPPAKVMKIDDYFKSMATSVLKDLYGKDFEIKETNNNKKISVVPVQVNLIDCPVCNNKISNTEINSHLDECLNKDIIENICSDDANIEAVIKTELNNDKFNDTKLEAIKNIKTENILLHTNIKTETIDTFDKNSNIVDSNDLNKHRQTDKFAVPKKEIPNVPYIKMEPSGSEDVVIKLDEQKCPCCDTITRKPMDEHLEECLGFFNNDNTVPKDVASTSCTGETIVIEEDDIFDETLTFNATGTKFPCPCCLQMVEQIDMNEHLDVCLS